jgi:hypothetical protein
LRQLPRLGHPLLATIGDKPSGFGQRSAELTFAHKAFLLMETSTIIWDHFSTAFMKLGVMTDKEQLDSLKSLADFWADSYERRRQVEWKVSLGFWAVILGGILNNDKLVGLWWVACVVASVAIWLSYVFIWLVPIQVKNERDKVVSYYYMNQAKALLQLPLLEPSKEADVLVREIEVNNPGTKSGWYVWPWSLRYYSVAFHAITTAVLLFALNYILWLHRLAK